jgi:hypothetical protein
MFVTYTPEGDKGQTWAHHPDEMRSLEQDLVEKYAGTSFSQWTKDVLSGGAKARRVLLWLLLRKEHRGLKFGDVDFAWSELVVEPSRQELLASREQLADAPEDPQIAATIAAIDASLADAPDDPDAVGKARLPYVD